MIVGTPGGRQLAVGPSADARGMAAALAAYSGVREGWAGPPPRPPPPAPRPRPAAAGPPAVPRPAGAAVPRAAPAAAGPPPAPRAPPPPPPPASQTPLKSGSLAMAAQSAAVGVLVIAFWATAAVLN